MISTFLAAFLVAATLSLGQPQESDAESKDTPNPETPTPAAGYTGEAQYLDADGNQRIDAWEFAHGQQMASMILMLAWDECDRDDDGGISLDEFRSAADEAMQAMLQADSESETEQQAEDALARAVPLKLLLDQLAGEEDYAQEVAALRESVEDLNNDEGVVAYVSQYPTRYSHLTPVIQTWVRHYPVRPELRRLVKPGPPRAYRPSAKVKPHPPGRGPKAGKPGSKKPPRPGGKPSRKGPPPRKP
jgi:hypothetical protein